MSEHFKPRTEVRFGDQLLDGSINMSSLEAAGVIESGRHVREKRQGSRKGP